MRQGARVTTSLATAFACATCIPSLGRDDSTLAAPRILAVRADPAEAVPGSNVTFRAFVAGPAGPITGAPIAWSFCTAPLPLTEDKVVSNACLGSSSVVAAGTGPSVTAATPSDGCSRFGPDTPAGGDLRPTDPDATGGYYQPLRADLSPAETAFALPRIRCPLAGANAQTASAFAAAYIPNQNPALDPLGATTNGMPLTTAEVSANATVNLVASWPAGDAETYAYFDPISQTVATQREAMQLAWYATAGTMTTEATGRASNDLATTSSNSWTAPAQPGPAFLFVVLRDSRGGVDFTTFALTVVE